ncbi:hypothetical protein [Streptosporangium sandarakinum]
MWGILTVYQVLVRSAADAAASRPGLDMDRLSFTVALHAARDQVTITAGILPGGPAVLVGVIGRTLLADLLPDRRRQRLRARSPKIIRKYVPNFGKHPTTTQAYTLHTEVTVMEEGLAPRPRR